MVCMICGKMTHDHTEDEAINCVFEIDEYIINTLESKVKKNKP